MTIIRDLLEIVLAPIHRSKFIDFLVLKKDEGRLKEC